MIAGKLPERKPLHLVNVEGGIWKRIKQFANIDHMWEYTQQYVSHVMNIFYGCIQPSCKDIYIVYEENWVEY